MVFVFFFVFVFVTLCLWGCFINGIVFVFAFVIISWLVRSCPLITLTKRVKGHIPVKDASYPFEKRDKLAIFLLLKGIRLCQISLEVLAHVLQKGGGDI